ncbi:hypothetical protein C8R46DRAFT_1206113 [Mycena filopes]|nr:hypothetical protein C8R46DRAFT_1206113 [Mycena filopes]
MALQPGYSYSAEEQRIAYHSAMSQHALGETVKQIKKSLEAPSDHTGAHSQQQQTHWPAESTEYHYVADAHSFFNSSAGSCSTPSDNYDENAENIDPNSSERQPYRLPPHSLATNILCDSQAHPVAPLPQSNPSRSVQPEEDIDLIAAPVPLSYSARSKQVLSAMISPAQPPGFQSTPVIQSLCCSPSFTLHGSIQNLSQYNPQSLPINPLTISLTNSPRAVPSTSPRVLQNNNNPQRLVANSSPSLRLLHENLQSVFRRVPSPPQNALSIIFPSNNNLRGLSRSNIHGPSRSNTHGLSRSESPEGPSTLLLFPMATHTRTHLLSISLGSTSTSVVALTNRLPITVPKMAVSNHREAAATPFSSNAAYSPAPGTELCTEMPAVEQEDTDTDTTTAAHTHRRRYIRPITPGTLIALTDPVLMGWVEDYPVVRASVNGEAEPEADGVLGVWGLGR